MKAPKKSARPPQPTAAPKTVSRGRLWLFRLVALSLPFLLLVLLELGLRLFGYGYATSFLQKTRIDGQECYINNDRFSWRFFPPTLARWPGTLRIPALKAPDTTRIFIFGESAAMGDPQPAYGASRYLEVLLRERYPGRKFEVINVAFTAINSHVILPIARECAAHDGDLWIIYMGNNEMVGPFGAATVFGSQAPPRAMVQFNLALQRTRVGQLAMATLRKLGGKSADTAWGGMRMFLQNQIPPTDPRRETVYRNFEANLRDIVRLGTNSGAKVILNTMSVNLRECPPFASLANSNLPAADREQFQKLSAAAIALAAEAKPAVAAEQFAQAAKIDPNFAEVQFRWADCLLLTSNRSAQTNYQRACDVDALPFRADSRINATIRRVAGEFPGSTLVLSDAEATLAAASPQGIAGNELFFEHVHFSFQGNYLLGRLWAEQVHGLLPDPTRGARASDWATREICDRDLGLTVWNQSFVLESVVRRMQQPPLSSQFNNSDRLAELHVELERLQQHQTSTNDVMRVGQALVDAIQRWPNDAFLQEGFANFLEAVGDRRQAANAYRKVLEILPHDFYAKLQLGRLYGELEQPAEGEPLLRAASQQRPTVPDIWSELGDVQMAQKEFAAALDSYTRGLELRPQDAGYISYQANALAKLGRTAEAATAYRHAIQVSPDSAEAHFELAGLLAGDNQLVDAAREYAEAIRCRPNHAVSRINYGVVLFRQGKLSEAIQEFETALRLDPGNRAAADYLRQASAQRQQRNAP